MMTHELSRSSDSSRTNSREILEVVLHKKGEEDDRHHHHQHHHHHHHHNQQQQQSQQQQQQQQHALHQLHQHRSADSSSRLSAMLVRTTHLHHNNLGELSRGPSSFSRKSLSRQSLDSNSHVSDTCEAREQCPTCGAPEGGDGGMGGGGGGEGGGGGGSGGVGAFLNSLALLAMASLLLAAMSLLLLGVLQQEHARLRLSDSDRGQHDPAAHTSSPPPAGRAEKVTKDSSASSESDSMRGQRSQDEGHGHGLDPRRQSRALLQSDKLARSIADSEGEGVDEGKAGGDVQDLPLPSLLEAAVAMATLVLVADLCCLMVCCMQCYFAAKLLALQQGQDRSAKYLRECSSSRFISVMGFFLSIPAFLVALVLMVIIKLHPGPALTSGVVLGVGGLFCVLSVMQNLYHWRVEKTRADEHLPVYEGHMLLRQRPPKLPPSPCHSHPQPSLHPPQPATTAASPTPGDHGSSQKNELATLV